MSGALEFLRSHPQVFTYAPLGRFEVEAATADLLLRTGERLAGEVVIRLGKSLPADVATISLLMARVRGVRDGINEYLWTQPQKGTGAA